MAEQFDMNAIAQEVRDSLPDLGNGDLPPDPVDSDQGVETGSAPEPAIGEVDAASPPPPQVPPAPTYTPEQLETFRAYEKLDQRLRTDPEFAQRFRQAFDPPTPPAPVYQESQYVDPQYAALQEQVKQQAEAVRMLQSSLNRQTQIENQAQLDRAKTAFKSAHSLDDTQMARVETEAQKYAGALQTLFTQGVDQQTALGQVFSAAYWNMPDMQQLELDRRLHAMDEDKTRKAKASSLSSGSGSAPRSAEGPKTEQQRRDAMTRDLAEVFGNFKE